MPTTTEKTTIDNVKMGARVKNAVTDFEGIVMVKARHLIGCDQIMIQGKYTNDKTFGAPSETVDVQTVDIIDDGLTGRATIREFPSDMILGVAARDKISGQSGTITALLEHFNGCHQVQIKPNNLDNDKKVLPPLQIDVKQVELLKAEPPKLPTRDLTGPPTGGPGDFIQPAASSLKFIA